MRLVIQGIRPKGRKKTLEMMELILIGCLLIGGIGIYEFGKEREENSITMKQLFKESVEDAFLNDFFPVLSLGGGKTEGSGAEVFFTKMISYPMPLYTYMENLDDEDMLSEIMREENKEDYEREAYIIEDVSDEMLSLLNAENGFSDSLEMEFVKNTQKVASVNLTGYETNADFVQAFYTVDSVTEAVPELFEIEVLAGMDMTIKQENDKPQILIYHTHSQEAFIDSMPGNRDATIVGAGDMLANILTEEYGYNVIHHIGEYDVPSRDYAYSKSLPALEQILAENPSIEVIIDLHRDGVAETTHLVTDINGQSTAKIMFFNGLSRTRKNGDISYLKNENLQENLAFSFQMQMAANEYYPGLTRKNYLNGYRYNMHLRGKSLLIELGAQTNTVEEIKNAIGPLAHILDIVLSGGNT